MNVEIRTLINAVRDKIGNIINSEYKVITNALDNDDISDKIKILTTPAINPIDATYSCEITGTDGKSLMLFKKNLSGMTMYSIIDGKKHTFKIKTHSFVNYTKDRIILDTNNVQVGEIYNVASSTTVFIKDTNGDSNELPKRRGWKAICFNLEFHITSKDDPDGYSADDVLHLLEETLYGTLSRSVEVEIDIGAGVLKKASVHLKGDLDYFDSIESKLNNIQKRIATAKFFFFVKY